MSRVYTGEHLNKVAFPLGGIGAGMICFEGTGSFSHVSVRNAPNVFLEPYAYSALCIKGKENIARVLEGPVPMWKAFGLLGAGNGLGDRTYGYPRFDEVSFHAKFPFGIVDLDSPEMPVHVEITAWSPFIPTDSDNSSLPVAAVEYKIVNISDKEIDSVYSFNSLNFLKTWSRNDSVKSTKNGFILHESGAEDKPWDLADFCVRIDEPVMAVNCQYFRGGGFDAQTIAWKAVEEGAVISKPPYTEGAPSPGGSIYVPFKLKAGESKTIKLMFSWYAPNTNQRHGVFEEKAEACNCENGKCEEKPKDTYKPWYSAKFKNVEEIAEKFSKEYDQLRAKTLAFTEAFYDSTLPEDVIEAVSANLSILKSPTVLRQPDGRLWAWEGCGDGIGCCSGSCTHVWNYAQAIPNLFPDLERTFRETEFYESQQDDGYQIFRSTLPISKAGRSGHAASDGQLGGIIKICRDWKISGDTEWLKSMWSSIKKSLEYCINTWDPDHQGIVREPHHNTYDIEFWGPDPMCTSFYLGALKAASEMAEALGDNAELYYELYNKGKAYMEDELYNGEYFYQKIMWRELEAGKPENFERILEHYSPEAREILEKEGPKYQYGKGCISDGVIGCWMAQCAELGEIVDNNKVKNHLKAVHKYNLKDDLSKHVNPQRPGYAFGSDGGLLLCTWPKGEKLSLPFIYSNEVWTGIEYQVAAHSIMLGLVEEGLDIVRTCRARYDGTIRNPFNEYECGHWYARALSSYSLLQAFSGAFYNAVEKTLYLKPRIKGDFRSFISTATGFGTVGVKNGKPFVEVKYGKIDVQKIEYTPIS